MFHMNGRSARNDEYQRSTRESRLWTPSRSLQDNFAVAVAATAHAKKHCLVFSGSIVYHQASVLSLLAWAHRGFSIRRTSKRGVRVYGMLQDVDVQRAKAYCESILII